MSKSKAHKYWNKFRGWARHFGAVRAEESPALEEFFINPDRIPAESPQLVTGIFSDWFLMDRKLTHCRLTPLELFIQTHERERKLKEPDLSVYRTFQRTNRFGIFRVEDVSPGEWMDLKAMPDGKTARVIEATGSQDVERGSYFIARIVAFEDHWAMSGVAAGLPDESRYLMDRAFSREGKKLSSGSLTPRDVLMFFMPKANWEQEGIERVRAKLASILQKSGIDIKVARIEENIREAHAKKATEAPLVAEVQRLLPHNSDLEEAGKLLAALWNLTIPECDPSIDPRTLHKGPVEKMLLHDMQRMVEDRFLQKDLPDPESVRPAVRAAVKEWLEAPQKELDGKTPRQAILEERKALGNPQEQVGFNVSINAHSLTEKERAAYKFLEEGKSALLEGDAARALRSYQEAYTRLRGHPEGHRLLGNLATAHAMMGDREKALEMLRASLKAEPDYQVARDNLYLLESMTPEEFASKHRQGFFGKMEFVEDTPDPDG